MKVVRTEKQSMENDNKALVQKQDCVEFPQDLQSEIVSWLPGKTLAKFSCVCKLWCYSFTRITTVTAFLLRHSRSLESLTTCPSLFHAFCYSESSGRRTLKLLSFRTCINDDSSNNNNSKESSSTLIVKRTHPLPLSNLPRNVSTEYVTVSNFCDGLVCVYNFYYDRRSDLSVFLYSVRTQDFFALPTPSENQPLRVFGSWHRQWLHWYSLGFEPTRREYRVLRRIYKGRAFNPETTSEYEILTVGSNTWKLIDLANVPSEIIRGTPSLANGNVCVNGVIYWIHCIQNNDYIASIDLASEEFSALSMNELVGHTCKLADYCYLVALNGHPALLFSKKTETEVLLYQWTLPDHTKKIVTSHIAPTILRGEYYPFVGGTMILRKLDLRCKRYYFYNLENDAFWDINNEEGCEILRIGY